MASFNYYIKYTFYLFVLSHTCACTGILGEINAFANSTRGNTTMGARGGGGKSRRSIGPTPPPPLKNQENFFPLYAWGNFCFYFLHVGAFLLRFSHYSYSSQRGGGNSRQLSPLNKIRYLHGRLFAAFSMPFLHVRVFLLRFSHYNFVLAEGGGGGRASLGVRPSLKK